MADKPNVIRPSRALAPWKFHAWELLVPRVPPVVLRVLGHVLLRLPPGSRVRRWCIVGVSQLAWEVTARTRFDLVLPIWDPDCEWRWDPELRALGFDEVYRGHDGVRKSLGAWNEVWDEPRFTIREILDGGNRLLMHMTVSGRGAGSGAPVEVEVISVAHLDPLIVRFFNLADEEDAMRIAGFAGSAADGSCASGRSRAGEDDRAT